MAREASRVFGEVAEDYDRVRPGYPAALVDQVFSYGVPPGPALEMGAGTGKATVAFAGRGREITAIEPDPAMAALLRVPGVRVVSATFEQFAAEGEFALLYAADAWHWTDPATRWQLAERALAPGGVLALIINSERVDDPAMQQSIVDVYAEHAPSIQVRADRIRPDDLWRLWPGAELAQQAAFVDREAHVFPHRLVRSPADQLAQLATRSQFRMLPVDVRDRIRSALILGGDVPIVVDAVLYLARRAAR